MILTVLIRMFRAAKLDTSLYEEIQLDTSARAQSFLVVILVSLAGGVGAGIAGIFRWAGAWSIWLLLTGLISSIIVWVVLSFLAYVAGTRLFKRGQTSVSIRTVLCATGFSTSPLLLGFFLFIPVAGVYLWIFSIIWTVAAEVTALRQITGFGTARAIISWAVSWFGCLIIGILISTLMSFVFIDGNHLVFGSFNSQINSTVRPYRFSITSWEINTLPHELGQWIRDSNNTADKGIDLVKKYFSAPRKQQQPMEKTIELVLEKQVEEVLLEQDFSIFPPVNLKLDTMPDLLVVSPRNRIESIREIMLDHDLTVQEIETIETGIDNLDVSSLVVKIGGFGGAYPSFVANDASLPYTVSTAVEEWIHQYLAFRPLGFRYVLDLLGIARDYEIATMNETVAGMVSDEISAIIVDRYYPEYKKPDKLPSDFDLEMREIRLTVDEYLAEGKVDQAEEYMENQRQQLDLKGYYVRKLNQAYFAWHGTYADKPTSVSPIGDELRQLRNQCDSVKEFLDTVSVMTSREDLKTEVENPK